MQTLYTGLNPVVNASYSYTNVTNLIRMCKFNQEQFTERVLTTSYRLPHDHPLVQLVEFMQIDSDWTEEELLQTIEFKTERWASIGSAVGVYNSGRLLRNVLYRQSFRELLISLPPQYEFTDYLKMPMDQMCPFIPVFSDSCEFDFRPFKDKPVKEATNQFAFIGVDFMCLAVAYWRYQKDAKAYDFELKPEQWLAKYPLMNAQLLGNRLVVLNTLYDHIVTGKNIDDLISVPRTTYAINNIEPVLKRTVRKYDKLLTTKPMRNIEALIYDLVHPDTLPTPELNPVKWKDPGKYEMYLKSRWVWNFSYMKILTVLFYYNRQTRTNNGYWKSTVQRWLKQDVKLNTQEIKNPGLEKRFIAMRAELEKQIR